MERVFKVFRAHTQKTGTWRYYFYILHIFHFKVNLEHTSTESKLNDPHCRTRNPGGGVGSRYNSSHFIYI